jgi:excisionase family DNA binding protein
MATRAVATPETMPKITKAEAARLLGKSERAVERYSRAEGDTPARLSVTYEKVPGRTRDLPMYDEAEVMRLAEELSRPQAARPVLMPSEASGERALIATRPDNSDGRAALLSELLTRLVSVEERQVAPAADKLLLNLKEVRALTGLSEQFLREAIHAGRLKGKILGRGYKVKRADLEAFVKRL